MKYKIKKVKSRERLLERVALVFCIGLYFFLFTVSEYYSEIEIPEWMFEIHKRLPK